MKTLKVLSALLTYPTEELIAAAHASIALENTQERERLFNLPPLA